MLVIILRGVPAAEQFSMYSIPGMSTKEATAFRKLVKEKKRETGGGGPQQKRGRGSGGGNCFNSGGSRPGGNQRNGNFGGDQHQQVPVMYYPVQQFDPFGGQGQGRGQYGYNNQGTGYYNQSGFNAGGGRGGYKGNNFRSQNQGGGGGNASVPVTPNNG